MAYDSLNLEPKPKASYGEHIRSLKLTVRMDMDGL